MAAKNEELKTFLIFCLFSPILLATDVSYKHEKSGNQYCSFFNNRAPSAQPGLRNCTWFKENSCCLQQEIEVTFSRVKPLKGASLSCQKHINYLMCYICAPTQNQFYQNERLTVCEDFCNQFYEACKTAILKGSPIKYLYSSGKEFCLSRRFLVSSESCFDFDPLLDVSKSSLCQPNVMLICLLIAVTISFHGINLCPNSSKPGKETNSNYHKRKYVHYSHKRLMFGFLIIAYCTHKTFANNASFHLEEKDVKTWVSLLSEDFRKLAANGLQFGHLENIMKNAKFSVKNINSTNSLLNIKSKLSKLPFKYIVEIIQ